MSCERKRGYQLLTYDSDEYKETEHDSSQDDWYINEDWIFHSCVRGLIDVSLHHG